MPCSEPLREPVLASAPAAAEPSHPKALLPPAKEPRMQLQSNGPVPTGHMASEAAWESHPSGAVSRVCSKTTCHAGSPAVTLSAISRSLHGLSGTLAFLR